jgi:hypothetical protein
MAIVPPVVVQIPPAIVVATMGVVAPVVPSNDVRIPAAIVHPVM